jgi:hypothetical protein
VASQGPNSPGACASESIVGDVAWTDPSNALSSNNVYATCALLVGQTTHYLLFQEFGFTAAGIAAVTGITLRIERKQLALGTAVDLEVVLFSDDFDLSAPHGDNKAAVGAWPESDTVATYGGASDLWGWTSQEIISGIGGPGGIQAALRVTGPGTLNVDHATMTLDYTTAGGGAAKRTMMGVG